MNFWPHALPPPPTVLLVVGASKKNGIGVFWCFSLSGWCWRSFWFKLGFQKRLSTPQNLRKFLRIQIWNKMLAFLSETLNLAASFIVGIQCKSWPKSHCPLYIPFTFFRQWPPGRELDKKPNASYITYIIKMATPENTTPKWPFLPLGVIQKL